MKYLLFLVLVATIFSYVSNVEAKCVCRCFNGENQPICDSTLDIEPICPPKICPIESPSIEPLDPITIPPIGTDDCYNEYVYNENTGRYEWQVLCY